MDYVSKMHKNTYSHHFAYNFPEFIRSLKEFMNPKFGNSTLTEHVRALGRLWRRGKVLKGTLLFFHHSPSKMNCVWGGQGLGVVEYKIQK